MYESDLEIAKIWKFKIWYNALMTCTGRLNTFNVLLGFALTFFALLFCKKKNFDKPDWLHRESDKFHLCTYQQRVTARVSRFLFNKTWQSLSGYWQEQTFIRIYIWILDQNLLFFRVKCQCRIYKYYLTKHELIITESSMGLYESIAWSHCVVNKLISSRI